MMDILRHERIAKVIKTTLNQTEEKYLTRLPSKFNYLFIVCFNNFKDLSGSMNVQKYFSNLPKFQQNFNFSQ